ncbi:MAG: hypothetical protein CM15mV42_0870 [uncultured marine virus]|nr:MAG: hypothetical protein CM15mV42_0870 [uncultured marine virus]
MLKLEKQNVMLTKSTWFPFYNEEDGSGCLCSPDSPEPKKKELPNAVFWKQDLIKMNAFQRDRDFFFLSPT